MTDAEDYTHNRATRSPHVALVLLVGFLIFWGSRCASSADALEVRIAGGVAGNGATIGATLTVAPNGLALVGNTLYVSDSADATKSEPARGQIVAIDLPTGWQTVRLPASAGLRPGALAVDAVGTIFFAVNDAVGSRIFSLASDSSTPQLVTGSGYGFVDGPTDSAVFNTIYGLALCRGGLLVSDANNGRLRMVAGAVSTAVAGLKFPTGVVCDFDGRTAYVAELTGSEVVRIAPDNTKSVLAGPSTGQSLSLPYFLTRLGPTLSVYESGAARVKALDPVTGAPTITFPGQLSITEFTALAVGPAGIYRGTTAGVMLETNGPAPTVRPTIGCMSPTVTIAPLPTAPPTPTYNGVEVPAGVPVRTRGR